MRPLLASVISAMVFVPTGGVAQVPAVLGALKPGVVIRVSESGIRYHDGQIVRVTTDSLTLRNDSTHRSIPLATIDSVWVQRHNAMKGATWGYALGAAVAVAGWWSFCAGMSEGGGGCPSHDQGTVLGLSALTAIPAGLIGLAIGAATPSWELRHPPRPPKGGS